ncbi:MAG: hypothetical protein WCJ49_03425, partial [Deltaproteobacteria bacterium]
MQSKKQAERDLLNEIATRNHRSEYLHVLKQIVSRSMTRHSVLTGDLCPQFNPDGPKPESLRKFSKLNSEIDALCDKMKAVEVKAKGRIGCPVLFGRQNISNPFRIVLAFLTAKSLSDTTGSILRSVSSICEYCGANDVPAVLEIR